MLVLATANTMFPLWVVIPGAIIALVAIAGHLASLRGAAGAEMPGSRRRIRLASGGVLILLTLLLTYALGFVEMLPGGGGSASHIRAFVIVWMAIMALVPVVLALAGLDVLNTVRIQRAAAREMRGQMRAELWREVEIHVKARLGSGTRTHTGGAGDDAHGR